MPIQIFGTNKSNDTKKAQRFFKERSLEAQFFDLSGKISVGQLKTFVNRFGIDALIDKESKAYEKSGLEYMRLSDDDLLEKLLKTPKLMQQPLLKDGKDLSIGWDEQKWRAAINEKS